MSYILLQGYHVGSHRLSLTLGFRLFPRPRRHSLPKSIRRYATWICQRNLPVCSHGFREEIEESGLAGFNPHQKIDASDDWHRWDQ